MDTKIRKVFLDKSDNIYITDNSGYLYLYANDQYFPFMTKLENIKNCFLINDLYFVYHQNTISIFDKDLCNIEVSMDTWITKNIDDVCYNPHKNLIVTLEKGEVYVNLHVTNMGYTENDQFVRISLNHNLIESHDGTKIIKHKKFENIKIVDNILLAYKPSGTKIYTLEIFGVKKKPFIINVSNKIFNDICEYNDIYDIFTLQDGSQILFDVTLFDITLFTDPDIMNNIYYIQRVYWWISDDKLYCYYDKDRYYDIVEPLIKLLSATKNTISHIVTNKYIIDIALPSGVNISTVNNKTQQIIVLNNQPYLIGQKISKINFDHELVCYDSISELYSEKMDTCLFIDIDNSRVIVPQLLNIIPYIYRLNNDFDYQFQYIDSNSNVISYGEGVTRDVFNILRMEIDQILNENFCSYSEIDVFNLGKLMYFCNRDGFEKFFNIHPYFFFLLSRDIDHVTLIKKMKWNDFNLFYDQYKKYVENPSKIKELGLNLESINDYVKYLMIGNLTETEQRLYEKMVDGFMYFTSRNKYYNFFKDLSIVYYINQLIGTEYFNATLDFSVKNESIDRKIFSNFKKTFCQLFNELSKYEKSIFCQNVTGSQYHTEIIHIVLAYEKKELIVKQAIYDEDTIVDEDNNEIIEPVMNNIIINLDTNNNNLDYQISTCDTELMINVFPSEDNLRSIINLLIINDKNMKN